MHVQLTPARLLLAFALSVSPVSASAQRIHADLPPCAGNIAVVRLSEIKPHGMTLFRQAAAAQQAWYRHNGVLNDQVFVAPVYVRDRQGGFDTISETEAYTFHINPPTDPTLPRNDAAWKDFVRMFETASTLKSEHVICLPKITP